VYHNYEGDYDTKFKYCRSCRRELVKETIKHQWGYNRETGEPNPIYYEDTIHCPKWLESMNHDRWSTDWYTKESNEN
jgi:hypothetical protein